MATQSIDPIGIVPVADGGRHERFLRLFAPLRRGEGRAVLLFFAYAFLLLVCYYILKTLREPLLLRGATAATKSYAYATVALVLLALVPLYGAVFRRAAKSRVATWITTFFVANLAMFCIAARVGVDIGFAYYVWVGVFGVTIVAQFWAHAADTFDVESGQRLFPPIMAGATLGGLVGPVVARALYSVAAPWLLLLVATAVLAATLPLVRWTREAAPRECRCRAGAREPGAAQPTLGGFGLVLRDRYLLLLAALAILLNCVNTTGEYILTELVVRHADQQIAVDAALDKGTLIAAFYADYFFAVNALTVLTQVLLVARVFRWIGVHGALLVSPIVAVFAYGLVLFVPIFALIRVVKIVENSADYSIANTARQALYLPLATDAKYEGKIATDTFLWRCGDLLQAGIVFAGLNWLGFDVRHFAVLNMALGLAWLAVAIAIARRCSARTGSDARARGARPVRRSLAAALANLACVRRAAYARGVAALLVVAAGISFLTGSAPAHADLPPSAAPGRPGPLEPCSEARSPVITSMMCWRQAPSENPVRPRHLPSWNAYAKLPPHSTTINNRVGSAAATGGSL